MRILFILLYIVTLLASDSNTSNKRLVGQNIKQVSPEYSSSDTFYSLLSGFYGSVGLTYISNEYSNKTKNAQKNFMQEYKLGYRGNIYSPKLVEYSVMGILRYEDIKSKINDVSGKTRVQSEDYKLDFNFLKNTKDLKLLLEKCLNGKGIHIIDVPVDYSENERVLIEELQEKACLLQL